MVDLSPNQGPDHLVKGADETSSGEAATVGMEVYETIPTRASLPPLCKRMPKVYILPSHFDTSNTFSVSNENPDNRLMALVNRETGSSDVSRQKCPG